VGKSVEHSDELPRASGAPALARKLLDGWFGDSLAGHELDSARLLVSELVTNSVVHGQGQIRLAARMDDNRILVEVCDEGSSFEHTARSVPFDQLHGRGLGIVDALSSRWGIHEGTTHVWFEIERSGPRLGPEEKPVA
jgi:anti-sigma regulatory factor (Ser/Thr protein kinase)